jgi:uncharacterized membrane protein
MFLRVAASLGIAIGWIRFAKYSESRFGSNGFVIALQFPSDPLWLMVVVALVAALWIKHRQLGATKEELDATKMELAVSKMQTRAAEISNENLNDMLWADARAKKNAAIAEANSGGNSD